MGEQTYFKLGREYSFDALVKLNQPISCRSEIDFFCSFLRRSKSEESAMGETRACRGAQDEERVSWPLLSLLTLFPQADK